LIAVDTNLLVYAHREDASFHTVASARIVELAQGQAPWAIPWPCVHEFLSIVTHARIFKTPTPIELALDQIDAWRQSPSLVLLGESDQHWDVLRDVVRSGRVTGPQVHDARIAAICMQHGVRELWSADRDFGRFPGLRVVNPLVA
jgi:uncharacterized protein